MARVQATSRAVSGLEKSLGLLASTPNEAATAVLVPALDSPDTRVQHGAVLAIFERRSPAGHCEILKRLHIAGARWRPILEPWRGRMSHALRDAVLGGDRQQCANGCQAILWLREYDLVPALIAAAENETNPHGLLAAQTLLELADLLGNEPAAPDADCDWLDPQIVRQHVTGSLESSVKRFHRHRRTQIVHAFLMVARRDNATLKQVLQDAHHPGHRGVVDCLANSTSDGVIRLLLDIVEDADPSNTAIGAFARRGDAKFLNAMLRHLRCRQNTSLVDNLKRMESPGWLKPNVLDQLDEASQSILVHWIKDCDLSRRPVIAALEYLLTSGKPAARTAAAAALAIFGADAAKAHTSMRPVQSKSVIHYGSDGVARPTAMPAARATTNETADRPHDSLRKTARKARSKPTSDGSWSAADTAGGDTSQCHDLSEDRGGEQRV